jgi:N-acetylglucosamine-6-phosphate deacetylase
MTERFLIKGLKVYTEQKSIKHGAVLVENGKIADIFTHEQHQRFCEKITYQFSANSHLIPGFIDLHMHGCKGYDIMDGTDEALNTICQTLPKEGTTSFLATTLSLANDKIEKALDNIKQFKKKKCQGAEILGIHLEGPFISQKKPGIHNTEYLQKPTINLFQKWQELSDQLIKIVTLAPEVENAFELINYLSKNKIIPAIGHSNASFEDTIKAIQAHCTYATHLFNAMSIIHQRHPGCAIACLLHHDVYCEIIADNIHLHPAMIHLAQRLKGYEKLILVTDSMRGKCMPDGIYDLGGKQVTVKNNQAKFNNTIAGSTLSMIDAFKNVKDNLHCTIEDLIKMTATNPARVLNILDKKGTISKNKDADLIVLDESLDLKFTVCRGKIVYEKLNGK